MIRKANPGDLNTLLEITRSCAKLMESKGIFQWNDSYPSLSTFENDVTNNWLYVNIKEEEIIGCICISIFMDKEYHSVCLLYTSPSPRDVEESRMPSSA